MSEEMSTKQTYDQQPVEDFDQYDAASEYLVWLALTSGNGRALRSVKALMDVRDGLLISLVAIVERCNLNGRFPELVAYAEAAIESARPK